ncbi:MAG: TIGR04282 family arsenosugar biosynthesis glycosyltransferase [Cyclonatronaceae bacterium]
MSSSRLIIFVKNPVPGRVKTRLAADIGPERALELYVSLLKHTFLEASKFTAQYPGADAGLYFSDFIPAETSFPVEIPPAFQQHLQQGEGLGARMKNAFAEGISLGYSRQVIIGSDCPQLTAGHLKQAFDALKNTETVIGPARDGGYYLLGMNTLYGPLFELNAWSHGDVYAQTLDRIREMKLSYAQIEELSDVDTGEDLRRLGLG